MARCVCNCVHEDLGIDDVHKTLPLPKYTHLTVSNMKGTPYHSLARVYPNLEQIHVVANKDRATFIAVRDALERFTYGWVDFLYRTITPACSGWWWRGRQDGQSESSQKHT